MKNGWVEKRLDDVVESTTIGLVRNKKEQRNDFPYEYVKMNNISNDNRFDPKPLARVDANDDELERFQLRDGDLLFNTRNSHELVGKSCVYRSTGTGTVLFNNNIMRIRFMSDLSSEFAGFAFSSDPVSQQLKSMVSGTTNVAGIYYKHLKNLMIPFPPLPEQQRIVGILDEAFAGIAAAKANAEKNLQNARALFESHLQSVFLSKKWKWKTLGDLCDGVEYGSSAKSQKRGKVPVLRMGNIQDGQIDWENLVYTDDKDEIAKYLLKHNDVLFNRTNSPELVGKTAIYKSEMPAIFAGYLIRINRKEDLMDGDYLNYFLNSKMALDYGKTVVISSVNQANINGTKLKGYPIPTPSISEQRQTVKKLNGLQEQTQRLASLYEKKLAELEALKKSLLQQAFTGAL